MELELKDWEEQNTLDMKEDEGRLGMKNSSQRGIGREGKKRVEKGHIDQTLGYVKQPQKYTILKTG